MNKLWEQWGEWLRDWDRHGRLTRKLLLEYLLSLAAYVVALFGCLTLAWLWCSSRVWYAGDPLYEFLLFIEDYLPAFLGLALLVGWTAVTYFFLRRSLGYLDRVVAAAGQLTEDLDRPIRLPAAIGDVQQELEAVRERAWQAN